jgi:hypothetical protein
MPGFLFQEFPEKAAADYISRPIIENAQKRSDGTGELSIISLLQGFGDERGGKDLPDGGGSGPASRSAVAPAQAPDELPARIL